jgi:hypothetical protein
MCLIIFSHSNYFYIWDIISEYIAPITPQLHTIFIYNTQSQYTPPVGFSQYIEYDSTKCYASRWLDILPQIDHKYILVMHDVCVLVSCNVSKIHDLFKTLYTNSIDKCSLNVFNGTDIINSDIPICNLNDTKIVSNTIVPYDVSPSIWNKQTFYSLWNTFPTETYAGSELNNTLQNYCKYNLKCYGIQKTDIKLYYCIGRPYPEFFKILHLTIKGELMAPSEVYADSLPEYLYIVNKYKLESKININHQYTFLLKHKMI